VVALPWKSRRAPRWRPAYIKKNGLQDSKNRRNINADDKLKAVFGGKSVVNMFEMTKLVNKHVK
jgi:chromatin remodeling complex protein RSC6